MSQIKTTANFNRETLNRLRDILSQERTSTTIHQLTTLLVQSGFSVVPIPIGKKYPEGFYWQDYEMRLATFEELDMWFNGKILNYGIVCGKISGIVVIDIDDAEALEWCLKNLPPPMFKCKSGRGQHWYYKYPPMGGRVSNRVSIKINSKKFKIDIRADGGLIVGPGSTHESGMIYELL